jgi:hypothetical protein
MSTRQTRRLLTAYRDGRRNSIKTIKEQQDIAGQHIIQRRDLSIDGAGVVDVLVDPALDVYEVGLRPSGGRLGTFRSSKARWHNPNRRVGPDRVCGLL